MQDLLYLVPFALFFGWLIFSAGGTVSCENCNAMLPRFQSPLSKTKRQWWEGGVSCLKCGCDCDRRGNKVRHRVDISFAAKRQVLTLVAAATIPAIVMLGFLILSQ